MTLVSKTFELYGKTYTFESGELAKQAFANEKKRQRLNKITHPAIT